MSERKIAQVTGIPKTTVHDHLHFDSSRTARPRGRKPKIDSNTINKMIKSLYNYYNERVKPCEALIQEWKLCVLDRSLQKSRPGSPGLCHQVRDVLPQPAENTCQFAIWWFKAVNY